MPTFARQQDVFVIEFSTGTSVSVDITPSALTSLLVAIASERGGLGHADHAVSDGSGGAAWTKVGGHDQEITNGSARNSTSIWFKKADFDTQEFVTLAMSADTVMGLTVIEFTTDVDDTWTAEDIAFNDSGTSAPTSLNTGTTGSVSSGDLLALAIMNWRTGSTGNHPSSISFDGSFADLFTESVATDNRHYHAGEWFQDTAGGIYSSTASWTGGSDAEVTGGVVVFRLGAAGGGGANTRRYRLTTLGVG